MASKALKKNQNGFVERIKAIVFSTQGFPLVLIFTLLAMFFVVFRMKGIELEYKLTDLNRDIEQVGIENKELKAQRARLLSVNRLHDLAKKYEMKQPGQGQIILVP